MTLLSIELCNLWNSFKAINFLWQLWENLSKFRPRLQFLIKIMMGISAYLHGWSPKFWLGIFRSESFKKIIKRISSYKMRSSSFFWKIRIKFWVVFLHSSPTSMSPTEQPSMVFERWWPRWAIQNVGDLGGRSMRFHLEAIMILFWLNSDFETKIFNPTLIFWFSII